MGAAFKTCAGWGFFGNACPTIWISPGSQNHGAGLLILCGTTLLPLRQLFSHATTQRLKTSSLSISKLFDLSQAVKTSRQ
ncbi:unnamed protein product [Cylicocyclus nassatus]|uniref:Uncharacterized protein n=1 Tax=Cylicocyclus nassatus TaxID=53992 RepID=A0AA36GKC6_CYLNA|nr:unnamed protein product [Cylicocyclus nassatus]